MFFKKIFLKKNIPLLLVVLFFSICSPQKIDAAWNTKKKVTIMCYMNGDNNLAGEVLHAVDMMETIGSSEEIDIIALVDGAPGDNGGYGTQWEKTRLLHISKDDEIGVINSQVIEDMGEQNLGDPQVLEEFVKKCLKYRSEKYIFILFAHGRGIIDTQSLVNHKNKQYKSVLLSPDETGQRAMSHREFNQAVKNGLSGEKFHLMLFFSCLTNMVEVGYGLRDVTRYMIGSEDEIRIVNKPPGRFQIRGVEPEKLIAALASDTDAPVLDLGKVTIESFIGQYTSDITFQNEEKKEIHGRYPASLALVDLDKYDKLATSLDKLAKHLVLKIQHETWGKEALTSLHVALTRSQKYNSFLSLEYFDLQDILEKLRENSRDRRVRELCRSSIDILKNELILYERHTAGSQSHGVSIFLPSFLVPENVYLSHRSMYEDSSFSRDTSWAELIDVYRTQMLDRYTEILIDEYERACLGSDTKAIDRLNSKISWALRKDVAKGKYQTIKRYLEVAEKMERSRISTRFLFFLHDALKIPRQHQQVNENLLRTVEVLLISSGNTIPGA